MIQELFKKVKTRMDDGSREPRKVKMAVPADLLHKCPRCKGVVFVEQLHRCQQVCPECGYHGRLTAWERIESTADAGTFQEMDAQLRTGNPIGFPGYEQKLKKTMEATGLNEAVVTGLASIKGSRCVLVVMDTRFIMASMGAVVGEKITRAFEAATQQKLPVVLFAASGGARMQEGMVSLMQMAKTSGAIARHSDAGLLYICVLTDPTTGGVTASFASLGDIILAEPKVQVGFAGRRVIEATIREKLPEGFQTAEFLLEHGFVDQIEHREKLPALLGRLLALHERQGR